MEQDLKILEEHLSFIKNFDNGSKYIPALENLIKAYKELEEENKIIKGNYYTLCVDIQMVTSELGFPEDTIIADEMVSMIKENYIPVSLVEEKIEELDIKITYIERQYTNGGQNCNSNYLSALYQKQILQELLGKRK